MPESTLGLDLGPNSIGWALIDEAGERIVATGVRVFPEGVDRDQQGGEKSKTAARRDARGARRQIARRSQRKRRLRVLLTEAGLLPSDHAERGRLLEANPYALRRRGLDEALTPHEFGRTLLHLNQRRGFLSNRKTDKTRASETKGMLAEINELAGAIQSSGCRTLGEYLARLDADLDRQSVDDAKRIRHRHTRRDMYEQEFEMLWAAQQKNHPQLLTDECKERVRSVIFYQRKMYWLRSVVGRCDLEPKLHRCSRADRAAQQFRILQEVNNLRLLDDSTGDERSLNTKERAKLLAYLAATRERKFDQIRKKLGLSESVRFNYERAERNKLRGHETDAILSAKKVLGKAWMRIPDERKDAIVAVLIEEEREDEALRRLREECGLSPEEAEKALAVNLPDGYMSYSREAIVKLLPHLERGLLLMADDETNSALHAAGYLRPDERTPRPRDLLPPAPDLPNPIVRQALVEVRKVVNAIIREWGKPARIHVELAREAKRSLEGRREILIENAQRRRAREGAAKRIEELGVKPTRASINRYLLWEEQERDCVYSGRPISLMQLLSDAVDVDHILPRWRSLDDSMANKVVCFRKENREKGDRTPREWLEESDPEKYERVLQFAKKLPYGKYKRFTQKKLELKDFVERQLRDTAYISRCVTQYLRCLGARILCPRGPMTAELRHFWSLNTILDPSGRGEKNRADHRHHAIDAVVIALTNDKRLHSLASSRGKDVPVPWERLRDDVEFAVKQINVSHRVRRRIAGALHKATFYGPTQKPTDDSLVGSQQARPWAKDWIEDNDAYVRRKPITDLTKTKHLGKVRDATIRRILEDHLRQRGIDPGQTAKIPGDAFKGENAPCMPSGVPIRRVRMLEESETFRRVSERRAGQHVKPGSNHHIAYRCVGDGEREKWTAEVATMWDAALRARNGMPVVDRSECDGHSFVMSLSIGELFQIDDEDGQRRLCVVRKLDQRSKGLNYKLHTDARPAGDINKDNLYLLPDKMRQVKARKVTVDPLGKIRWAHD